MILALHLAVSELINTDGKNVFGGTGEASVDIIEIMGIQIILEIELEAQNQKNVVWQRGKENKEYVLAGKKIAETNLFLIKYEYMKSAMRAYQEIMDKHLS